MYHQTLNAALDAANVKDFWPLGSNINYGQTVRHLIDTGDTYGRRKDPVFRVISVYLDERGLYETAVTYKTA